ncbi:MAG: hypothetical protein RL235_166 [Chlamydiota bacterium]|jgi:uncharacterized integral membrane protein (TIGR00697 family)
MGNEFLFLCHIALVIGVLLTLTRFGQGALVGFVALAVVLSNIFIVKQMRLFGMTLTCSDVYAVGAMLGLNMLQEFYGKRAALSASKVSLLILFFFLAAAQIHLHYAPLTGMDEAQSAFELILGVTPRLVAASLVAFAVSQRLDVALFGVLQRQSWPFAVRSSLSTFITQLVDTLLFSFLGLYGWVAAIGDIIVMSLIVKGIVILFGSSVIGLAKMYVRQSDVSV